MIAQPPPVARRVPETAEAAPKRPDFRWSRLLTPSFADCLAVALLVWLFASGPYGWLGLLSDGDTGWHIRTGEFILDTGTVPTRDFFSYTKPGEPWFAWEWLSATILGALHRSGGLKAVTLAAAVLIIAFATVLFRHMIWRGANLFAAMLITFVGVGASSLHYLARPHLFTLVLLPASLWLLDRDRRQRTWTVWLLVPLTGLWTNLHGGFLALVACIGLLAIGSLAERQRADALRYASLCAACGAASILNPYGYQLHLHMWEYLRSDWIRKVVVEFKSPSFRDENVLQFEVLLFMGLATAGLMARRRKFVEPLWILFWAHQALMSVRHITVFVAVAAPVVAFELSLWWNRWVAGAPRGSNRAILDTIARERIAGCRWNSLWVVVPVVVLAFLGRSAVAWPTDFPDRLFPSDLIGRHQAVLVQGKTFTSDDWADYLLYRHYPHQRVFFDGRSDFYGQTLGEEYIRISDGRHDWEQLLDRHRIDVVLSPVHWPLGSLLKGRKSWQILEDNGKAILFRRTLPPA